jgi:chromosomal replication initiation ATPase DnaA
MPILGCKAFAKTISEKYLKNKKLSSEISQQKYLKPVFTVKLIKQVVAKRYNIDEAELKTAKRKGGNLPRQIAIYLSCKLSGQKYKTIAEEFADIAAVGVAKISERITQKTTVNGRLNEEITLLEKDLISFVNVKT